MYKQINAYRADKGLPPLALDAQLTQQARLHSQLMASNQIPFNEEGIIKTSNTVANLIPYRGISTATGVNQGYANPARANVDKLLNSDRTIASIEGQYELTGVGIAKNAAGRYYFTQIFIYR